MPAHGHSPVLLGCWGLAFLLSRVPLLPNGKVPCQQRHTMCVHLNAGGGWRVHRADRPRALQLLQEGGMKWLQF